MTQMWLRWKALVQRRQLDRDLEEELRFHLEMREEKLAGRGHDADEARYAARRKFGNATLTKEVTREMWTFATIEKLWQDVRYGARVLRKSPAFTLAAIIALALGIGANTAIFSLVNAVLLHPLPYKDPARLVWITNIVPKQGNMVFDADYFAWKKQSRTVEGLAAYDSWNEFTLTGVGEPERLRGVRVTSSFFQVLGNEPRIGRGFSAEEDRPRGARVAILSDSLWRCRFSSDASILGRAIALGGEVYMVVGVLPPGFEFPENAHPDVLAPFALEDAPVRANRALRFVRVVGRLGPGVTLERATAELDAIGASLHGGFPGGYAKMFAGAKAQLIPLRERLVGNVRNALMLLLGAVGFVLLIACANVANLQLARAVSREKEMAIRGALGAGRGRLARQLLTESTLLGLFGGGGGVLLALWLVSLVRRFGPRDIPYLETAHLDWTVLAFTLALSIFTGILFGFAPVLSAFRVSMNNSLKEGGSRSGSGARARRPQEFLMVGEIALALVLFIGAGLLVRSFVQLVSIPPGFDPHGVLTAHLSLPAKLYAKPEQTRKFFGQLLDRTQALPGVQAAGAGGVLPLGGYVMATAVGLRGQSPTSRNIEEGAYVDVVTPGYFPALRIPLLAGRPLETRDVTGAEKVLVVNQAFQKRFFPQGDPLGQQITIFTDEVWTIVGVVGDAKQTGLPAEVEPEMFVSTEQYSSSDMTLVIRTQGDPLRMAPSLRAIVAEMDKDLPLYEVATFDELVSKQVAPQRFNAIVLGTFAALALLLAAVGIYGVMAYSVSQRKHEIGVRMALGAASRDVLGMVLAQGLRLALVGVVLGLADSYALTRLMATLLYGVKPTDLFTFAGVTLLLLAVALGACWIPARRASKVSPMIALRYE